MTQHLDMFGDPVQVGDYVVYAGTAYNELFVDNELSIGRVEKLNPKMIKVSKLKKNGWQTAKSRYARECMLIDQSRVTLYILKRCTP